MIGNEGSTHFAYFELKGVFDESSSDEIIVLPLKALVLSSDGVDGIFFVQFPVLDIIPDGAAGSSFDLKHKRIAIFIYISAIDLRSQKQIVVHDTVAVVI